MDASLSTMAYGHVEATMYVVYGHVYSRHVTTIIVAKIPTCGKSLVEVAGRFQTAFRHKICFPYPSYGACTTNAS